MIANMSTAGLEKFIADVKNEKVLWQLEQNIKKEVKDAAWRRLGSLNKMSVQHAKSILNILYKKYNQEKSKVNSNWKLFRSLRFLDNVDEEEGSNDDEYGEEEDTEFVELLEVTEGDSDSKENSEEEDNNIETKLSTHNKDENKLTIKTKCYDKKESSIDSTVQQRKTYQTQAQVNKIENSQILKVYKTQKPENNEHQTTDLKKFPGLTIIRSQRTKAKSPTNSKQMEAKVTVKALNESRSTDLENLKKLPPFENFLKRKVVPASAAAVIENGNQIHRETDEEPRAKRISREMREKIFAKNNLVLTDVAKNGSKSDQNINRSNIESNKKEIGTNPNLQVNCPLTFKNNKQTIIDLKSKLAQAMNSNNNSMENKNSFEEIEIKQEIDFDADFEETSNPASPKPVTDKKSHECNLNNNELPKFFLDFYKSKTYDSFGMYVSSTLNRLPLNLAKKLEVKILQSILDVNSMNTE